MKRIVIAAFVILPVLIASAQNPQRPVLQRPNFPQQTDFKAGLKAGLDVEPAGEPSGELTVDEFQLKRNDLKGQVIELTFDRVVSLKQAGAEGYMAMVTYESPRIAEGLNIIVPADGLEFFEDLSKVNYPQRRSVYIQVLTPSTVKALGTRYSKNKEAGERYSW